MGIETKYICDNCKTEVPLERTGSAPYNFYEVHVSVKRIHAVYQTTNDLQHWCRACCDRLNLFHKLTKVPEANDKPLPTLEDVLREFIGNIAQDVVDNSRS